MSTLKKQYEDFLEQNPNTTLTHKEWLMELSKKLQEIIKNLHE
jgi:hypothetical protein